MVGQPFTNPPYLQISLLYQSLGLDGLGNPIFLGIFNNVEGEFPVRMLFIVSNQYTNGFGMHRQYTTISDPDNVQLAQSEETQFFLQNVIGGQRNDQRIGLEFRKDGRHSIRVFLDGELVIEHYFMVRERRRGVAREPAGPQSAFASCAL